MADYFSEYTTLNKGTSTPIDTPYEPSSFIRSKRSSRATIGGSSSRDGSSSPPPPLPLDFTDSQDRTRDGLRSPAVDPRRFTPTLHASLVSEILNLRRELDSKNHLVENLETNLSNAKTENDVLSKKLADSAREVRKAKQAVQTMEQGTYDAVEDLAKELENTRAVNEDLRLKMESLQKKVRQQDEDAVRTQNIWENEKEAADNERRQLERRLHVTESRLRTFVDEMAIAQQATTPAHAIQIEEPADEVAFKDSALGNESDTASVHSPISAKHERKVSDISSRNRNLRSPTMNRSMDTPEPMRNGHSLADELGGDDESDEEDYVEELEYNDQQLRPMGSRQSIRSDGFNRPLESRQSIRSERLRQSESRQSIRKESFGTPKRIAPIRALFESPTQQHQDLRSRVTTPPPIGVYRPHSSEAARRVVYVDRGYQPSPSPSPPHAAPTATVVEAAVYHEPAVLPAVVSLPDSPNADVGVSTDDRGSALASFRPLYTTAATQTDLVQPKQPVPAHKPKEDSLSALVVPSISIHPPSSRPASPQPYVLPPGTRNASCQVSLAISYCDASMQTEEIRIDKRVHKLAPHLQPALLPSPPLPEYLQARLASSAKPVEITTKATKTPANFQSSTLILESETSSPEQSRTNSSKDLRSLPLKALPLPRPVLSPPPSREAPSNGPLNRATQYGVTQKSAPAKVRDKKIMTETFASEWSDYSDYEDPVTEFDLKDVTGSLPAPTGSTAGRFGGPGYPAAFSENKETAFDSRPETADSYGAAPAPSVASSRAPSQQQMRSSKKAGKAREFRSRSPSAGSAISSSYSAQSTSGIPPYPIPLRSSSKVLPRVQRAGSVSPTARDRTSRYQSSTPTDLRKVQSATVIRARSSQTSSPRVRRRRRSPNLTPVQSMAFDSPPIATDFPIPELPATVPGEADGPLAASQSASMGKSSRPTTAAGTLEQPNLVDAIAATMVGEWMWKYIRKRKSFGIGDDSAEVPVPDQNGILNIQAHGTRHKRWVWLSPYERTIMWDNKQPTSGIALLGKKGRKLAIQSVLDVQDPSPLPKQPELSSAFNRSILILTPERALKFTAIDEQRHHLWMTALSFLAQNGQSATRVPNMPATLHPPPNNPSFGRSNPRDSIRVAKGKRPDNNGQAQDTRAGTEFTPEELAALDDGADFPSVPRLYVKTSKHQRKRSNTLGPHRTPAPLANIRSFSSTQVTSNSSSPAMPPPAFSSASPSASAVYYGGTASSYRSGSAAARASSTVTSPDRPNFFEAVGTIRMEAFVDPAVRDGVRYVPAGPPVLPMPSFQVGQKNGSAPASAADTDSVFAASILGEVGIATTTPGSSRAPAPGPRSDSLSFARHTQLSQLTHSVASSSSRRRGDSNPSMSTMDRPRGVYSFDDDRDEPYNGP